MKQLQVIVTIDVTNDEYSALLNKQTGLTIDTLILRALESDEGISCDFPAVLLDLPENDPVS